MADWEMIKRCAEVLRKHHIMSEPTAAIIALEFIKAMREPTEKMIEAGLEHELGGVNGVTDIYTAMIDAILND